MKIKDVFKYLTNNKLMLTKIEYILILFLIINLVVFLYVIS